MKNILLLQWIQQPNSCGCFGFWWGPCEHHEYLRNWRKWIHLNGDPLETNALASQSYPTILCQQEEYKIWKQPTLKKPSMSCVGVVRGMRLSTKDLEVSPSEEKWPNLVNSASKEVGMLELPKEVDWLLEVIGISELDGIECFSDSLVAEPAVEAGVSVAFPCLNMVGKALALGTEIVNTSGAVLAGIGSWYLKGVKVDATGDSFGGSLPPRPAEAPPEIEINGSWDPKRDRFPNFDVELDMSWDWLSEKAGGRFALTVPYALVLGWFRKSSGEKELILVSGVPWWDSISSEEFGLPEVGGCWAESIPVAVSQCPNVDIVPIACLGCGEKAERFKNDEEEKVSMLCSTKKEDILSRFKENEKRQENAQWRRGKSWTV